MDIELFKQAPINGLQRAIKQPRRGTGEHEKKPLTFPCS
jgi:hypothetical protein